MRLCAAPNTTRITDIDARRNVPWTRLTLETYSLRSLVHHAGCVDHDLPLEQAHRIFTERGVEFLALVRDGMVTGLCSRLRLGILFGTRFGFALHSRSPAHLAQVEKPLVFPLATPVRDVLDQALARSGDEFHEDVVLVDEQHALVGLVPIDALARLQNQFVSAQLVELQRQHQEVQAAHQAIRESQGLYAGLFESHALGIALVNVDGTIPTHNRRLTQLFNAGGDNAMVASLSGWIADADRPLLLAALESQARGNPPTTCEVTVQVPERGPRLFRCSLGWIAETRQICACLDDVTEQRELERRVMRQEKQTLLDTLVGGIAHELNNKLAPVQGFSELIALTVDPQNRQYADAITRSVTEAATIIRQLLQLSKPSASVTQLADLRLVVADALGMLRFHIRDSRCAVRFEQPQQTVSVRVDPAEIKQVVMNLVLNALQAMDDRVDGAVVVEIIETHRAAQIVVRDNGMGIPPENIERIFDPFFTTKGTGTGLGLSVCFSIVRRHGGEINVESAPDAGATFTVSLPLDVAAGFSPVIFADATPTAAPPAGAPPNDGARVLVVDDEPHVRRLIREILVSHFSCDVDVATNGIEALEKVAETRYALVISDLRMPAMNGTELYLWLREAQPLTATRFIFVTGYPGENHLEHDLADWRVPVLTKPFTVARLCELCAPFLQTEPAAKAERAIA